MATRLKTVEFAHPPLASMVDNTLTALTQITVYLPETGTKTFKSVSAQVSAMATATGVGNISTRRLECRLGAAAFTSAINSQLYTGSAEDIFVFHSVDLTAHFTANWSGTSMTFDSSVLFDGTQAGIAFTNISVSLFVTYEYDDTSTTQVKTIRLPLNAPATALATSKPASANATIPNLSTELPEASKVFRSSFITVQGNVERAGTGDPTITMQLDATTAHTTGIFEGVSNTDYFYRYIWNAPTLDTSASMGFFIWGSATDFDHPQVWLTVTYEFDASAANDVYVSVLLPMEVASPMGLTNAASQQRGRRELWIEEPGSITTKAIAFFAFWDQAAAIGGLNQRVGTGSFVAYSSVAATLAGSCASMCRNDSAFVLARGRNELQWDVYRTDTTDLGMNVSGFWIVNYTASKPTQGYGAANHTVRWAFTEYGTAASVTNETVAAVAPALPETDHFRVSVGVMLQYFTNTTGTAAGMAISVERLVAEGGVEWEPVYTDVAHTDSETGLHTCFGTARSIFNRWTGDPDPGRISLQTARRWRIVQANAAAVWSRLEMLLTYHTITFAVAGTISGSAGGTVTINVCRASTGERVASTSRVGDGAFSVTWYDNTEEVYVEAWESSALVGRSDNELAA